jgi:uncharacterized Zn finger protein
MSGDSWGSRWLDLVESAPTFDPQAMRRGSDYAAFDWQLDVEIEPGRATTTASSGRRMRYHAGLKLPTLSPAQIDAIVESIAGATERMAAVLDGELPLELEHVLSLDPADIVPSCTCQSIDQPCKHAAAVAHLVADAIADDPFDLLHLRGLPRADLVARLAATRRNETPDGAGQATPADDRDSVSPTVDQPVLRYRKASGPLPADLPSPDVPGRLPPFPTPPPAGASFTEQGLRIVADDGARRAAALLTTGRQNWAGLDLTTDLARLAAETEGTADWKSLVDRAQVTSQELRARAQAWRAAGRAGVEAHVAPAEVVTDSDNGASQRRRTHDGSWVRFEKIKGRWSAVGIDH